MGLDGIITIAILAVAGTWAGRRLWRAARNRVTGDPDGAACGGGGCGHCPLGTELGGGQPGSPCVDSEALAAGGSGVTAQPGGERAHGHDPGQDRDRHPGPHPDDPGNPDDGPAGRS